MGYKWSFSTNLVVLSFSLLMHLAWQTEASKPKTIDDVIEASNNRKITSLSCHVCHSETDTACFNFTQYGDHFEGFPQNCEDDQLQCVVKKFAFTSTNENGTIAMKTFSIKRNCTKKCENGCVVMGERTRLYVCSQCCKDPLCNVGSGSGSVHYIDNSFQYFLTSVAHVSFFAGTLQHVWHVVEMMFLLCLQLLL